MVTRQLQDTTKVYKIKHRSEKGTILTDSAKFLYPETDSLMQIISGSRKGFLVASWDICERVELQKNDLVKN